MIISNINKIRIEAMAAAVPTRWTSLLDVSNEEKGIIKKFIKKTGVEGRYNCIEKQTSSDLCYAAAKRIIESKNIDPSEIGILVFVSQTSDYILPATACVLQDRLQLSKNCIAFDVNLGCSGFTYGINIVSSLMNSSNSKKALLLCGDTTAKEKSVKRVEKSTHSASMLFGDSGTATLLEKVEESKEIRIISKTDGSGYKSIIRPFEGWRNPDIPENEKPGSKMDDIAVFNFAVSEVPELLRASMELAGMSNSDYDCLVLHQANLFILKQIAKRTGFPMDKVLVSLDKFGNTSSASIPITMVKAYGSVQEDRELHALMCGFGVGLSWSTVDCYINISNILPLVHTDEYFVDGYTPEA